MPDLLHCDVGSADDDVDGNADDDDKVAVFVLRRFVAGAEILSSILGTAVIWLVAATTGTTCFVELIAGCVAGINAVELVTSDVRRTCTRIPGDEAASAAKVDGLGGDNPRGPSLVFGFDDFGIGLTNTFDDGAEILFVLVDVAVSVLDI